VKRLHTSLQDVITIKHGFYCCQLVLWYHQSSVQHLDRWPPWLSYHLILNTRNLSHAKGLNVVQPSELSSPLREFVMAQVESRCWALCSVGNYYPCLHIYLVYIYLF